MTADGGAQNLAKGVRSMAQLADLLADPKGPVLETIDQLPALMAEVRAIDSPPFPALVHQADQAMASVDGLVGGARGAGGEDPRRPAGDAGRHPEAR